MESYIGKILIPKKSITCELIDDSTKIKVIDCSDICILLNASVFTYFYNSYKNELANFILLTLDKSIVVYVFFIKDLEVIFDVL